MDAAHDVIRAATARATALADVDREGLEARLHEDFRWTSHLGETYGREEYVRRNTQGHTVWRSQGLGNPEVVVAGDTAVLLAEVTDVIVRDGEDLTFRMRVTQVWVRGDDGWLCLAGHAGPRMN
jgi:ketosteroid isomerase-like protein